MIRSLTSFLLCLSASLPLACAQVIGIPDPHSEFPKNQTVVWSPVLQASWDQVDPALGGKPSSISSASPLMKRLDAFEWDPETVMPEEGWQTWAGPATREFLDKANREATAMSGNEGAIFDLKFKHPDNLACFGLLNRDVEFLIPFFRSRREPLLFGAKKDPVQFFGVRSETAALYDSSVRILSYHPGRKSHAVELVCKDTDETVILYLPADPQDFATACKWIRHWRNNHENEKGKTAQWNDGYLHEDDDLRIPYLTLDVRSDFTKQLVGTRRYGEPPRPWFVAGARQHTKFKLYEKGARIRSSAVIEVTPFGSAYQRTYPRDFIYDRPFFVFMWRANADWPYLGVWVGDSSAMTPRK